MSVYLYATDPGARIEPTAGEKTSGFVPSTPSAAKKLNDVLYELTAFAINYQTLFAEEHDPSDGTHTNITGTSITLTGLASADDGKFTGDLVANSFVFGNNSGVATDEPIAIRSLIVQGGALSDEADNGSVVESSFGGTRMMTIVLTGGDNESCIIPFYVPGNSDLDRFHFIFTSVTDYDMDWELLEFDYQNNVWDPVEGGPVTGNLSGGIMLGEVIIAQLQFPDTNGPNTPGHGVRIDLSPETGIPGQKFLGLKIKSNSATSVYIQQFSYLYWVSSVERAIQR